MKPNRSGMRTLIATLAVCASLVSVPATAAETAARPHDNRPPAPAHLAGLGGDLTPPTTPLERLDQGLVRPMRYGGSEMIALHTSPASSETTVDDVDWAWPMHAGDLDGDGYEDVITEESGERDVLVARSGISGAGLWSLDITRDRHYIQSGPFYPYQWLRLEDVNGDGAKDLTFITMSYVNGGYPVSSAVAVSQTVSLHDGRTGEQVWSWEALGSATGVAPDSAASALAYSNVIRHAGVIADVTGDGLADPLVALCDGSDINANGSTIQAYSDGCEVVHLDRTTGARTHSFRVSGTIEDIAAVEDLNGDGLGDVVVTQIWSSYLDVRTMTAFGETLHWSSARSHDYTYAFSLNLDGGNRDLVIVGYDWDESWSSQGWGIHVLDGSTGNTQWSRDFPPTERVAFVDDINADGGYDLVHTAVRDDSVFTRAYDGARFRTQLWSRTDPASAPPGMQVRAYVYHLGDLDDDGVRDLAIAPYASTDDEWATLEGHAVSGRTRDTLWSIPEGETFPYGVGADLNGNGTDDVTREVVAGNTVSLHVLDGLTLTPLWQTTPVDDGVYASAFPADLTPGGGLEVVTYTSLRGFGTVIAGEGSSGRLWGLRYEYDPWEF